MVLGRILRIRACVLIPALAGSQHEGLVILQQDRTGVMGDREPCPAEDRKVQADHQHSARIRSSVGNGSA